MSTRNFDALFRPRSIALIGASNQKGHVGNVIAENLLSGGFDGDILLVSDHAQEIAGARCYPSIAALPRTPDLAIIATPPSSLPGLIHQLGKKGCRAAIVVTAGLDGTTRNAMCAAARPFMLRILGPNCLGFMSPGRGVNASFAHLAPLSGRLALVSQSGAIAASMIDWANGLGIGFSHILSLGDMADIDFGDALDFLATDTATSAILLYAESVTHARKFMSAARIAARMKPVIVVKAGRTPAGAKAATSHTGALAGSDVVYDAAFRRAGMLRVDTLRDLLTVAETLASGVRVRDDTLAIITNGGGLGVMATDELGRHGIQPAALSDNLAAVLSKGLPAAWSQGDPIDILGDASGERYTYAIDAVAFAAPDAAVLVMNCPTGVADSQDAATAVIAAHERHPSQAVLACWMGEATAAPARQRLEKAGIPAYETPEEAIRAFTQLVAYGRNQEALRQAPGVGADAPPDARLLAKAVIEAALADGRTLLSEIEAKAVLKAYGIPVSEPVVAHSPIEAARAAKAIGGPVALKILSRQITHKSDVGGVALNLQGDEAVERAAAEMLSHVQRAAPEANIDGFSVQPMIVRHQAQELIVGIANDPTFGPSVLFGQGGTATEIIADRAVGLPPLNDPLCDAMIRQTRVAQLLAGYRDRAPADIGAIRQTLITLSDLAIDLPEISELDINPLLADAAGVIALDARIVVRPFAGDSQSRLAIKPYPSDLVKSLGISAGGYCLRPIQPTDADALRAMVDLTLPYDLRMRFLGGVGHLLPNAAARLCQIDYDREMALVVEQSGGRLAGVVRLLFDPEMATAELAILVRSDAQRCGLGRRLFDEARNYAGSRGAHLLWGEAFRDDDRSLELARKLAGRLSDVSGSPELCRIEFAI
ncbi:MAG: bifunctional acetate--CoA ligase family protein/GNAT family N-acetyltransferase [Alphaproteobacteria bacterium]